MENFKVIVITSPGTVEGEAEKIARLLEAGVDYVHIRKPDWSARDVLTLVEDIPYRLRRRLKLHGHFQLLDGITLGGVHLNGRNPSAPATAHAVSKSCHTLDEVEKAAEDCYEYVTLSPIFDSISKPGYSAGFDLGTIADKIRGKKVVALGGVTPAQFLSLRQQEFAGAALLGYVWNGNFESALADLRASLHENTPK